VFTGIISHQAVLREKKIARNQARLTFELLGKGVRMQKGASLAIDGACVSVSHFKGKRFSADLISDTLQGTTLGDLSVDQRVNVERALRLGDSLGGHWVSGHVDGVGTIRKIDRKGASLRLHIEAPADIIRLLVVKGSVAVDGISFTVQGVNNHSFVIGVTPHTYRVTTLLWKRRGNSVNLENDLFAKLVDKELRHRALRG